MPDHFATLGFERSPWVDPEELKVRFLALSAERHPDKSEGDKERAEVEFRGLNEAHIILRHTRTRLLHFLELEGAVQGAHVEAVPPGVLEFFSPMAGLTRQADLLLKEKTLANSPMLKVQFFQKALDCVGSLQELQAKLHERLKEIEVDLRGLDSRWRATRDRSILPDLQQAAAALGFLERWNAQLQERSASLTF